MVPVLYKALDWIRHRGRLRRWTPALAFGRRGEDLAHRYLRSRGYTIVARNYRTRNGNSEIDLIAWDGPTLVFVEVKSRANEEFGTPDAAVDGDKKTNILRAAGEYLRRAEVPWSAVRFDIVSVVASGSASIRHLPAAFGRDAA